MEKFTKGREVNGKVIEYLHLRGMDALEVKYMVLGKTYINTFKPYRIEAKKHVGDSCVMMYAKNHPKVARIVEFIEN